MYKKILTYLFFLSILVTSAQELNCLVSVNHAQVQGSNKQIFKTLERSLSEFVNQTEWTNKAFKPEEMVAMFDLICVDKKYKISSNVKDSLLAFLKSQSRKSNKLWNGREIRNLFEKALIKQARRLSKMTDPTNDQLMTLESSDLELPASKTSSNIVHI